MSEVTAEQLQQDTGSILDRLERGESLIVTRNGKAIARIEPFEESKADWSEIMAEVWEAQKSITPADLKPNPVLEERGRGRR